ENSPIDYLARNKPGFPDRSSGIMSEKSLFANNPFSYVPSNRTVLPRSTPLGPKDNTLNTFNNMFTSTQETINFNMIGEAIPSPFNEMTIYQLCSWLCVNPKILQLANNMHSSMQTRATEGSQFISSISNGFSIISQNQENKKRSCRDFLEELKCLFLCVRNPPKRAFEELIRKFIKCELNSAEGIEWLQTANRHFGDF